MMAFDESIKNLATPFTFVISWIFKCNRISNRRNAGQDLILAMRN